MYLYYIYIYIYIYICWSRRAQRVSGGATRSAVSCRAARTAQPQPQRSALSLEISTKYWRPLNFGEVSVEKRRSAAACRAARTAHPHQYRNLVLISGGRPGLSTAGIAWVGDRVRERGGIRSAVSCRAARTAQPQPQRSVLNSFCRDQH